MVILYLFQCFIVLAAMACVASAGVIAPTHFVRTPQFDSAVIKSDRLGGNFAYSTAENHAYATINPVVQHVATPVAVSYSAPALSYAAPALSYAHAAPLAYSGVYGNGYYGYGYGGHVVV